MVTPTDYAVTIKINDVDVTEFVPYKSMAFDDHAHAVSSFRMTVENPTGVTPSKNHLVVVNAINLTDSPIIFLGYIVEVDAKKRDNGITMIYELECADVKIRLQKSVLDTDVITGSDADILSGFLTNAYPDLSSLFDFTTDITSSFSNLEFPTSNKSILDALNELSDLTGNDDWRLGEPSETLVNPDYNVTFDDGTYAHDIRNPSGTLQPAVTGGNPNLCAKAVGTHNAGSDKGYLTVRLDFAPATDIQYATFDYYCNDTVSGGPTKHRFLFVSDEGVTNSEFTLANDGTWNTVVLDLTSSPLTNATIASVEIGWNTLSDATTGETYDYRVDNFRVWNSQPDTGYMNPLIWSDEPDPADFDVDIDTSDEFAFDIDLTLGDYGDFNSITVIGGFEEVGIDWTYESDGDLTHFDLELPIDDLIVYKNTGTDGSPTWTEQTLGNWGEDELTGDGGSKDVLYDAEYHWLLFNSEPSNLSKSIRVTGNIQKPVRIRINEVADGDPVFATTIQNSSIKTVDDAVAVGQAALEKQSAIRNLTFSTYEPGLKVGQSITVTDTERGLDESIVIRQITTKWLGSSGHAIFEVYCGDDDYSGIDVIIANNDRRSRENSASASIDTPTIIFLTDDNNVYLTDDDGTLLYYEE